MMYKIFIKFISIMIGLSLFIGPISVYGKPIKEKEYEVLLIYDREKDDGYSRNIVNIFDTLLHGFNTNVTRVKASSYTHKIKNNKYDYIFVIGVDGDFHNEELLEDLKSFKGTLCWIGDGIEWLLKNNDNYDIKYKGQYNNICQVEYKGKKYRLKEEKTFNIVEPTNNESKIYGTIGDTLNNYPYIIEDKNLFYVSQIDLGNTLYYIFCDVLYDIFKVKSFSKSEIFVRIEDVHPFRDTETLKAIADYLYDKGIPFMVALIPTYINPENKSMSTIFHRPEFAEAIRYMQDKGGSIVLHGYTHQYKNEAISGEGFEFWDGEKDEPLNESMEKFVKYRLLSGLRICIENGIYPIAFEAPHYAMDSRGYKELKKYFSTYVGQYQNNDERFNSNTFPYVIKNSKDFNILIPENLGFIDPDDKLSVEIIKENFDNLSIVRGYSGGFFFHPYLDIYYLKEVIDFLEKKKVNFMNLRDIDNWVKIDDIDIETKNGDIDVSYDENISTKPKNIKEMKFISSISKIIIIIISTSILLFIIIFIIFRTIDRKKFIR